MSDVSKTNEDLIAEARDMAEYSRGRHGAMSHVAMLDRLADALEAATRVPVQGEPNEELIEYALDYIENGTMRPERRKALQALVARANVPAGRLAELSMSENNVSEAVIGLHFSEAQVEAAAKAMWDLSKLQNDPEWGELERAVRRRKYRKDARAALVAAASVAPVLPSSTVDERSIRQQVATGLVAAGIRPHDPAYYRAIDAVIEAIGGEANG